MFAPMFAPENVCSHRENRSQQFVTLYRVKSRVLFQFVVDGRYSAVVEYHKGRSPSNLHC